MNKSYLLGIAFACSISFIPTASFAVPPSDDGRCDVLLGSTPGLFGLCMAYWATQANGNGQASSKILENTTEKSSLMIQKCPDCVLVGPIQN